MYIFDNFKKVNTKSVGCNKHRYVRECVATEAKVPNFPIPNCTTSVAKWIGTIRSSPDRNISESSSMAVPTLLTKPCTNEHGRLAVRDGKTYPSPPASSLAWSAYTASRGGSSNGTSISKA